MSEQIKLLIVEHNHLVHKSIDNILKKTSKYTYKFLKNYEEVFDNINNYKPDVLFLNFESRSVKTTDICKNIKNRKETKFLPVIFMIDEADQVKILKAVEVGANSVIIKPIEENILIKKIEDISKTLESELTVLEFNSLNINENDINKFEEISKKLVREETHLVINLIGKENITDRVISNIAKINFLFKKKKNIFSLLWNSSEIYSELEKFGLLKTFPPYSNIDNFKDKNYLGKFNEKYLKI